MFFALLPLEGWAQPLCQPVEMAEAQFRAAAPGGVIWTVLEGKDVARPLARFNAEPPASDFEADRIMVGISRDYPRALIVFGLAGCFVGHSWVPSAFARDILGEGV